MTRNLKKRPPVVVSPLLLSQLNCEPLCGIDPRRFLDLLSRLRIPSARVGRLRLVDAEDFRRRLLDEVPADFATPPVDLDRQPQTVDEVLARLGRVRLR